MGVRGLSSFFNQNPDLSKPCKLHDTPVIIDGNNLIHVLYFSYKVDCVYGGDYHKYASCIKKYLSSFKECNIKPIIIFDGGYDKSDRKLQTVLQRSRTRLTNTEHIAKYGRCSGKVLPIIAHEVFKDVLREMGIPFAQCDFEADDQVTALANHYKCPVISDDSDFYIFDIHHGFIRLDSVESTIITDTDENGIQYNYLKCYIYRIENFLSYFPGIDKTVLPLFSTLIGNDFAHVKVFENFFTNIQLPKCKGNGLKVNQRQRKIVGLLSWLKTTNLNDAISTVLCNLKKQKRDYAKSVIEHAVDSYKVPKCNLTFILDDRLADLKSELKLNSKLTRPCGEVLPASFIIRFLCGCYPSFFLNAISLHRTFLPSQVENVNLDSSFACSLYIRQVLYGILLRHDVPSSECENKECLSCVEEYDRRNGSLQKESVEPIFTLRSGTVLPNLYTLNDLSKVQSEKILSEVLGNEVGIFSSVPSEWQLLLGCIKYWLKNSNPGPKEEFIYALAISILYFSFLTKFSCNDNKNDFDAKQEESDFSSISSMVKLVSDSEIDTAKRNIKKYLQKPVFNNGNPIILHIVHSFSQLQTCILYTVYLNKVLNFPFKCPEIHNTFNGTLIYNLTKDILLRPCPDLFVSELLGRESTLDKLFFLLKNKIHESISPDCYIKINRCASQSHKKRKKSAVKENISSCANEEAGQDRDESELCNKFSYLNSLDIDSCDIIL